MSLVIEQMPDGSTATYDTDAQAYVPPPPAPIFDKAGRQWRQASDGSWQRAIVTPGSGCITWGDAVTCITPESTTWIADDPNRVIPFDVAPFVSYISTWQQRIGYGFVLDPAYGQSSDVKMYDAQTVYDPWYLDELFNQRYFPFTNPANWNPYASIPNRDMLRAFAVSLGLQPWAADKAALAVATQHYSVMGQPYSEAVHPAVIGDNIAHLIAAQAGVLYDGLTEAQRSSFADEAGNFQQNIKGHREAYQDAVDWTYAAQIASIFLPVVGYYVGIGAAAAAESAGTSVTVEAGADYAAGAAAGGLTMSNVSTLLPYASNFTAGDVTAPKVNNPLLSIPPAFPAYAAPPAIETTATFRNTIGIGVGLAVLLQLLKG